MFQIEESNEIKILFTVLESSEFVGDGLYPDESTMNEAVTKITSAINNLKLWIIVPLEVDESTPDQVIQIITLDHIMILNCTKFLI